MPEREAPPTPTDERDEVTRLKLQLAKAEIAVNEAEAFGKFDVAVPNVDEDTYASYLAKRPENGIIRDGESFRDTESGQFASAREYNNGKNNDGKTPQTTADYYRSIMDSDSKPYEEQDFSSFGLKQLVFEMAKAEKLGDKGLSMEIQDAMGTRLTNLADEQGWTSKQKDEQADILLAQVLKLSAQSNHEAASVKDAKLDNEDAPTTGKAAYGVPGDSGASIEPALEGESAEEYEARNNNPKIDTLDSVALDPLSSSEQEPVDDLSDVKLENLPEAKDADKLDDKEQSFWNKVDQRRKSIMAWAGAKFSTGLIVIGESVPRATKKMEETDDQFEARKKRYAVAAVVGLVAVLAAYKFYGLESAGMVAAKPRGGGGGVGAGGVLLGTTGSGTGGSRGGRGVDLSIVAPNFTPSAHNVTRGEGWYQTFREMGITKASEQAKLLQKVGPQLQSRGWAYPMKNGSWGISHTGQIPDNVLELIKNSR